MSNEIDIELNVLNLMLNETKQSYVIENLDKRYFKDVINSAIFECAKELYYNGNFVDIVLIAETMQNNDVYVRLVDITNIASLTINTEKYCKMLADRYFDELIQQAKTKKDFKNISELKEKLKFNENKIKQIGEGVDKYIESYVKRAESALMTNIKKIDNSIGSFMGGDYIALGGSTGTGKTSLALNIARQFCLQDKTVLYFSLEMPIEQLQNRVVCMNKGLNALKYRTFGFSYEEMQIYKEGLEQLKDMKLNVVCDYGLSCEKLKTYIRQQKKTQLDFVNTFY